MLELRHAVWTLGLLTITALGGCPERKTSADGSPKAQACTKAYEKCDLGTGVLGICDVVDCPPDTPEPCLQCRSQH